MTELSLKKPMSTSYKLVFAFSLFMLVLVFLVGVSTQSKTMGLGLWIWGYASWLIYKRRNSDLVSMFKVLLGFDLIACLVVVGVLTFSDKNTLYLVGYSKVELVLLMAVATGVSYGLYYFFKNQVADINSHLVSQETTKNSNSSIVDDAHWIAASKELEDGNFNKVLWLKIYSETDGDEVKTKARYVKLRALELQKLSVKSTNFNDDKQSLKNEVFIKSATSPWDSFGSSGKVVTVIFLIVLFAAIANGIFGSSVSNEVLKVKEANEKVDELERLAKERYSPNSKESIDVANETPNQNVSNEKFFVSVYLSDGKGAGWSAGHTTQKDADVAAKASCKKFSNDGQSCKKWFGEEALCVGVSRDSSGIFGGAWGPIESTVGEMSISNCKLHGGLDCKLAGTYCAPTTKSSVSSKIISNSQDKVVPYSESNSAVLSITRGSSWIEGVNKLRAALANKSINSYPLSSELVFHLNEIYNKPWIVWSSELSGNDVRIMEEKNIWWFDKNKFFIRLYNPSEKNIKGFIMSFSQGYCGDNNAVKTNFYFGLSSTFLASNQHAVFSADFANNSLPNDFYKSNCAVIVKSFTSK
jgi:hypothetical protein